MIVFVFSNIAEKKFQKLENETQQKIRLKLESLKNRRNIFTVLRKLVGLAPATHRLRVGDFRVILQKISSQKFLILDVGHRREIYKI